MPRAALTASPGSLHRNARSVNTSANAQDFWAVREWLVASAIGERLRVEQPFVERLDAGKLELAARLTNHVAIGISARAQRNQLTGISGKSVALQVALKTAQ